MICMPATPVLFLVYTALASAACVCTALYCGVTIALRRLRREVMQEAALQQTSHVILSCYC